MMIDLIHHASAAQAHASDPAASVFVSANAGTGKTKLLTDRVLRLLLAGAPADTILCVTYTRAAAAEMRNRINKRLGDWTIISSKALTEDLKKMGIETPSQDMMQRARSLFAEILDNDNGPRVETVHSFCQIILRRFPIEAGITPHARLADDEEQAQLKLQARNNVMAMADRDLMSAVHSIAEMANEGRADQILQAFLSQETRLSDPQIIKKVIAHFETDLQIYDADTIETRKRDAIKHIDIVGLQAVAAALNASGVEMHKRRAKLMDVWLEQPPEDRLEKLSFLVDALFTANGPRSDRTLSNAEIRNALPTVVVIQQAAIDAISPILFCDSALVCKQMTVALYRYGVAFSSEYERLKAMRGLLDYDDLINRTNRLLDQSDAAQWVSWKLDNGIQHMLIDEAQDTSPQQWKLLRRLIDDFFADERAEPQWSQRQQDQQQATLPARSIFAVGDYKQSIYSFQGADPQLMGDNRQSLATRAREANGEFRDVTLSVSFRSSMPVLQLVNALIPQLPGIEDFSTHEMARDDLNGFVEIWPVVKSADETEPVRLFGAPAATSCDDVQTTAAKQLADTLKKWIGHKALSSGKAVGPGDILILLRKRGTFFEQILKALQQNGISVAGADRMALDDQIEIQDLLALGDVMMLPEDDLQLAVLLKSPLCGFDDKDLYDLAYGRGQTSLYARLMTHRGGKGKFGDAADQLAAWRLIADQESVFGFFSHVLVNGGRQNFVGRLGHAVNESLDHFLSLAQSMVLSDGVSLLHFLATIRGTGGDVKRDMDSAGSDEVRVMTIHGAKGLEAPIVILPDMLKPRTVNQVIAVDQAKRFVYWTPPVSAFHPQFLKDARAVRREREQQEANRLLYVALTRACEGLVIAGWEKSRGVRTLDGSDYAAVKSAFVTLANVVETDDGHMQLYSAANRIAEPVVSAHTIILPNKTSVTPRPFDEEWIDQPARRDNPDGMPLRPSQLGLNYAHSSVIGLANGQRSQSALAYGRLAHRLLEILPSVPKSKRGDVAYPIVRQYDGLTNMAKDDILKQVESIIDMPKLAPLFSKQALAEVPINGRIHGVGVAGQIDRLYLEKGQIILADFKSGQRPDGPPPDGYVKQLALYVALLGQIYPDRQITSWLVWIQTKFIEDVTFDQRQEALQKLFVD